MKEEEKVAKLLEDVVSDEESQQDPKDRSNDEKRNDENEPDEFVIDKIVPHRINLS